MRNLFLARHLFISIILIFSLISESKTIKKPKAVDWSKFEIFEVKNGKPYKKLKRKRNKDVNGVWDFDSVKIGSSKTYTLVAAYPDFWEMTGTTGSTDFQMTQTSCDGATLPCSTTIVFTPTVEGPQAGILNMIWTAVDPEETHYYSFSGSLVGSGYASVEGPEEPCVKCGSYIRVDTQALSEMVPIVGTDFTMVYSSEHSSSYINHYVNPTRVSNFNPEGWTVSLVHYYDNVGKRLFFGNGQTVKRKSIPELGGNVMVVEGEDVFVFDSTGKHIKTKSKLTGYTKYSFTYSSGTSKLTKITDAFGNETIFGRNGAGILQTVTSPHSYVTNIDTNSNGLIERIENPNNEAYEFTYIPGTELLATFKKPGGQENSFVYNNSGELEGDIGAAGNFLGLFPDHDGTYRKVEMDTAELRLSSIQTKKDTITGEYYRKETSPAGYETVYKEFPDKSSSFSNIYESTSKTTASDERFGSNYNRISEISETINSLTRLTEIFQTATLSSPSDPYSYTQIVNTKEVNGIATTTTFVKSTKTETTIDPMGVQTVTIFDNYERPTSIKHGSDTALTLTYDTLGRLSQTTQGGQNTTDYTYNSNGKLQKIENALGQETTFIYDSAGRRTSMTLPDTRVIGYQFDSNGKLTGITPPSRPQHGFTLNIMDLISSYVAPTVSGVTSTTTTYNYNLDKQLTEIIRPDLRTITYSYGSTSGLLDSIYLDTGMQTYTYFPNSEKAQFIQTPDGVISEFEYFGLNDLVSETQTRGLETTKVSFTRDNFFRITNRSLEFDSTPISSVSTTYRNDNQPSQIGQMSLTYNSTSGRLAGTVLNKISDSRTYDTYGNLATYTAIYTPTSGPVQTLYSYTLTRDTLHRISSKTETIQGVSTTYGYTYDSVGRLSTVTKNSLAHSNYNYDGNSNRTSGNIGGVAFTATYDNQDRMLTFNLNTYSYNDNGDLISVVDGTSTTMSFINDAFGRLKSVTLPSYDYIEYALDSSGRRVASMYNGTTTSRAIFEDNLKMAADLNTSTALFREYVYGTNLNSPDYMKYASNYYRIIKDHLGSPRLVVKASDGTVLQRMDYNEWGKVVIDTNPGAQPFGFAGGIYDANTKLIQFGARDYDPETGRWTSKDPILFEGDDTNLYGYVLQDPVNFVDPEGKNGVALVVGATGAALALRFLFLELQKDPSACGEMTNTVREWIPQPAREALDIKEPAAPAVSP